MNKSSQHHLLSRRLTICLLAWALISVSAPTEAKNSAETSGDDQAMVECQLPPQIRSFGSGATILGAGQQVRTTIADCKVRGGKYDGHGPGALAGQEAASPMAADGSMAVMVGGDARLAACAGSGKVSGLTGKGALSVRNGPAATHLRVDRIGNGKPVYICTWSADRQWVGVVYAGAAGSDCGVSKPMSTAHAYAGACRSGWVSSRFVKSSGG